MSGSVSVSTKALRELPLPAAADVLRFFNARERSDDDAADAAYAASISSPQPTKKATNARKRRRPS
jgi:hypothetical protein